MERILGHCKIIDEYAPSLNFSLDQSLVLLDLEETKTGLRIIMDQAEWFMREGQLVLNLFLNDFRAFSLAFSLHRGPDGSIEAVIGGIQGRKREGILDTYRDLTKTLHGLRPRDFLMEVFRIFCRAHNIETILAVSDTCRHHRHSYFNMQSFSLDYDEIWQDRGGWKINEMFFQLDVSPARKELSEVKAKKRSMYRKRYAFLSDLEAKLSADLKQSRLNGQVFSCGPEEAE